MYMYTCVLYVFTVRLTLSFFLGPFGMNNDCECGYKLIFLCLYVTRQYSSHVISTTESTT